MKKKNLLMLPLAAAVLCALPSCQTKTYEIALVTDVGQLMDGSFNQGTWEGVKGYAEANNKSYQYYQPAGGSEAQDKDRIAAMELAIKNKAKVIVTPGFLQAAALAEVVPNNPNVKFVFIDGWNIGEANLTAACYKEHEAGFLAGYAASFDYNKLGGTFGGGGTNDACNRFALGYVQGIIAGKQSEANPKKASSENKTEIKISYKYGQGYSASDDLKAQIGGWYQGGTEVVFSCGGSMLQSVKAAAQEGSPDKRKIIGVDVDQYDEDKDRVITSACKGLTTSVKDTLNKIYNDKWAELSDKTINYGVDKDAVGLPTNEDHWKITNLTYKAYETFYETFKEDQAKVYEQRTYKVIDALKDTEGKEFPSYNSLDAWKEITDLQTKYNFTFVLDI